MQTYPGIAVLVLSGLLQAVPLTTQAAEAVAFDAPKAPASVTLKETFKDRFLVGVALNPRQFNGTNLEGAALVIREFNAITAENAMKWDALEPQNGQFRFDQADQFVEFGRTNGMVIIGHNLCWHSQLPAWVSQPDPGQTELTKEVLLARLKRHILTVASRYKGKVKGWDVVNEAINDGAGDYRQTVFYRVIGKEYLAWAFKWAHEADPDAELYYNDYNLDANDQKRATAIELVKYLREQGAVIHGIGLQGHYNLESPSTAKIDETIRMFSELGLKVHVTELDVRANAAANAALTGAVGGRGPGGPIPPLTDAEQQALAKRYSEIFEVFLRHKSIARVTFWGLRDADSWRRQNSPLIFDNAYGRKPAYDAIIATAAKEPK
jgi:endo-1,4-beta-xylanase